MSLRKQTSIDKTKTETNFTLHAGLLSYCPCSLVELVGDRSLFAVTKLAINFDICNNCRGSIVVVLVVYAIAFIIGADADVGAISSSNKPSLPF